ncbi:desumoylating isopeptidase [Holotrichia oblita]|uniref:Desumoylating isopeptidase n=1 Tax=Holotrichia oblita TaxID=644536 RepID=A0ACB9SQ62_HOLOL|nr:desumoylating isopeptidase [Holotrichia oblita]
MSSKVELYIYDLSRGMAASISPMLIGKRIEGIWHTSIVVYEREYFFGSGGVESCTPGSTALGAPLEIVLLGHTQVPYSVFFDYLNGLGEGTYAGCNYKLLSHNCNVFSNDVGQFLCGASIPKHILDLPNEILQSRLAPLIESFVSQLEQSARPIAEERTPARQSSPDFEALNLEVEATRYHSFILQEKRKSLAEKQAKRERKREKRRKKLLKQGQSLTPELEVYVSVQDMADADAVNGATETQLPSEQALQMEEDERREEEERKKSREPPIVFKDAYDIRVEFDALVGLIDGKLSPEEQTSLEELHKYMLEDEGSWALGDGFLLFVGRLLNDANLPVEVKIRTLNVLGLAALKDDVILLLHQDRRDHIIMNYAFEIDRITPEEQESLALFIANMFENLSSSEWLMYISEWTYNNQSISNIRVTTKVGVHSLLSDRPALQDRGTAIIHNLACKEVFDDVAVELTMALLQFFNSKPSEEHLFRSMKALSKFVQVSRQEVPQLIQMIGPDPKTFKGTSPRLDALIEEISSKIH